MRGRLCMCWLFGSSRAFAAGGWGAVRWVETGDGKGAYSALISGAVVHAAMVHASVIHSAVVHIPVVHRAK